MTTLLRIDASVRTADSDSRALADELTARLKVRRDVTYRQRDLAVDPIPHLDAATLGALMTPADDRSADQALRVAFADELIAEFLAADEIVISTPMYNFGIPSTLKAWFDHIARAGVTFAYTAEGPRGLAGGRRVHLVLTRGGRYTGSPLDHQEPYLRTVLNFLGITDITVHIAEGLNISEAEREAALAAARESIRLEQTEAA